MPTLESAPQPRAFRTSRAPSGPKPTDNREDPATTQRVARIYDVPVLQGFLGLRRHQYGSLKIVVSPVRFWPSPLTAAEHRLPASSVARMHPKDSRCWRSPTTSCSPRQAQSGNAQRDGAHDDGGRGSASARRARRGSNGAPAHRHDVAAYVDAPRSTRNVAVAERQPCLVARSRCRPGRRSRTTRVARPERSVRARRRPSRITTSPRQAAARERTRIWTRRLTPARRRRGRTDSRIAGRRPDPARVARHGIGLVAESLVPSS